MAKFPVEIGDDEGTAEAINYLLSGPAGLGQNFAGYSTYTPGYLTGNFRPPFTYTTPVSLFVPAIDLSLSEMLDERTWKFTFASTQTSIPFANGMPITVAGVSADYDGDYTPIGVVSCTTDYVIARTQTSYAIVPPVAGVGQVYYYNTVKASSDSTMSTDANGKSTITGGTDRVFLSAQLNNVISYVGASDSNLTYTVQISRLKGFINNDPVNPEYRFNPDGPPVAKHVYNFTGLTGDGSLPNVETIFTAIIDQPAPAFYWYILEIQLKNPDWDGSGPLPSFQVTSCEFAQRGLSSQVVKQ